ncbi:PREDICTED: uncharacterized protein LOC100631819 [Amphimedon queenslandica]|uniref:Threonyl/alanyl tRNA synthetase SAD domain-containing protein n=1 Tax=Amphimedon queenslandica TaxID=400682 RepID=A0A1X7V479_AMPQE|nr:PREDICTED: uncharacterized protein LOC100631819 [Amphimedon queenslandica]|eukprot:XP_003385755.1 PREDICTED: uncharacterized protein LOC100631819 [Amphimedon queenslandica]
MAAVSGEVPIKSFSTIHLYYDDTYQFSCRGNVLGIYETQFNGEERSIVVLDQTVMHPQGGGQSTDIGTISSPDGNIKFEVSHVQKPRDTNYIEHIGTFTTDERLIVGQEVTVEINSGRRCTNARIHSAGHLLDSAFINLGITNLVPSKGYHFPDGPYVEYIGDIPAEKREEVINLLNIESERLIKESIGVVVSVNERNEREVNVGGVSCMCGGTHVKNTAEIKGLKVSKIKKSKKNVRVSYTVL